MCRKPNHKLLAHLLTAIYSIIQYDFRKPDNQKLPAHIPTAVYFTIQYASMPYNNGRII